MLHVRLHRIVWRSYARLSFVSLLNLPAISFGRLLGCLLVVNSNMGWRSLTDENKLHIFAMLGLVMNGDADLHQFLLWDRVTRALLMPLARSVFCGACHSQLHLHCAYLCSHFRLDCRCFTCWQPLAPSSWPRAARWAMVAPRGPWNRHKSSTLGFRLAFQRCALCDLPPRVPSFTRYQDIVEEGGPRPLYGACLPIPPLELQEPRVDLTRQWLLRDIDWENTLSSCLFS